MYCLVVYTTLLQLFISFDVTNTSANTEIPELPVNKHKAVNASNNNNNVELYNVSKLLHSHPLGIIFNPNLPMNSSIAYVLKIPVQQSNKTSMTLNTCECWEGLNSRIFRENNTPLPKLKEDEIDFLRYHSYEKINNYLHSIVWKYPHLVRVEEIGKSFEKRNINLIRISAGEVGTKAMILITGGMNGNEWISSATILYAIQQLVENSVNSYMLEKVDWYIIPLMNPDGYVYSRNHDHNWKNTRSCRTNHTNSNNACLGVDLNKNFDFNCNHSDVQDTSNCSGQYPFSESEAMALSDFLMENYQMHLYLNINDYGQYIDYPLGTYEKEHTDDVEDLKFLAEKASEAVYKYGGYKYSVRGFNSCGSEQWARKQGIKYVYNIKLGTKSQISESEVLPIAQEVFMAIRQFEQIIGSIYSVMYDMIDDD